jgi:hypothetical protein
VKKPRVLLPMLVAMIAALTMSVGHTQEPTDKCDNQLVDPTITPLGIGLEQNGDPTRGTSIFVVCSDGPIPIHGAVVAGANLADQSNPQGYLDVDGNSTNADLQACLDGFIRGQLSPDGATFYDSPDGSYTDTNPKKAGDQQAKPEDLPTLLEHFAACYSS